LWSPLRASGDHRFIVGALRAQRPHQLPRHLLRRPRVARARKIIRLHPLLCCLAPPILYVFSRRWAGRSSSARVERTPSDSSPSPEGTGKPSFTARIERPPLHRGGSASKKDGCLFPHSFFSAPSRSSLHPHLLPDLLHGTPTHRASLSNNLATPL